MEKTRVYLTESLGKPENNSKSNHKNIIGKIVSIIGFLLIIISIVLSGYFIIIKTEHAFLILVLLCSGIFLTGLFFLAIAHIITLLQHISNKL